MEAKNKTVFEIMMSGPGGSFVITDAKTPTAHERAPIIMLK